MQIYSSIQKGPLKSKGFIDPNDSTIIQFFYGSPVWSANTVYLNDQVVRATNDTGYYYMCTTNGKTGSVEPAWTQDETISGTALFKAIEYNLWVIPTEYISNSVWTASNSSIVLTQPLNTTLSTSVMVSSVPSTLIDFELTNQVTKSTGEVLSRTVKYLVNQQ